MKTATSLIISISIGLFLSTSCDWNAGDTNPYSSEEIVFSYKQFDISGELCIPEGNGSFPIVILVHGDGPAYARYYSIIKKSFIKAGYATLIWDKPGFGKSKGEFTNNQLQAERAGILLTAIDEMKNNPKIRADKIGVWGISQAGYVIPRALERSDDISFMILVGCGGENGIQQTAYYIETQMKCIDVPEEKADEAAQNFINLYYVQTFDEYYKSAKSLLDDPIIREMGFVTAMWTKDQWKPMDKSREDFFNPISIIEKTNIPTLVFFGELDKNVDPVQGMQAYQAALEKAKNPHFEVRLIKGADHDIIPSETGCETERYSRTKEEWSNYDPEYLNMMETWLKNLNPEE